MVSDCPYFHSPPPPTATTTASNCCNNKTPATLTLQGPGSSSRWVLTFACSCVLSSVQLCCLGSCRSWLIHTNTGPCNAILSVADLPPPRVQRQMPTARSPSPCCHICIPGSCLSPLAKKEGLREKPVSLSLI